MINYLRIRFKLWKAKRKGLHYLLEESEATLYINKPDYAYLEVNGIRYYFHNSDPKVVRYKNIKTFSGEKLKQSILPYDGYEITVKLPNNIQDLLGITRDIDKRDIEHTDTIDKKEIDG